VVASVCHPNIAVLPWLTSPALPLLRASHFPLPYRQGPEVPGQRLLNSAQE
jgi:hypothetical protein